MTISYLDYKLENGYIHNWLVAGPQAIRIDDLARYTGEDWKTKIAQQYYEHESGVIAMPAETETLKLGEFEADWEYFRCPDDHFVDLTSFYHICHYLRAWAYTQIVSKTEQTVNCVLTTNGPADVWVNGEHIHRQEHFYYQLPKRMPFQAKLKAGVNEILVRFEEVAARDCPYAMALQLVDAQDASVRLPTAIENVESRKLLERAFYAAYLKRDQFKYDDEIQVHWPRDFAGAAEITIRVQNPLGHIYSEGDKEAKANAVAIMGNAFQFPGGMYEIVLMPRPRLYYEDKCRIQRKLRCWITGNRFSTTSYDDEIHRKHEAMNDALRRDVSVFSEIAQMTMNAWHFVDPKILLDAIERINQRNDCSDFYLAGLLGMWYRFGNAPEFPQELKQPLEDCILNFKYWHDEPGSDSMWYTSENHAILFHTCEVLAGQLYPDRVFTNTGETGAQHRAKGEQRALTWLRARGMNGFVEWDSNCYFDEDVLALTHLASLAESDDVAQMASVVLDKMFFTMAVNSYKGVFGSTHGRTYNEQIKCAFNESTSGISRILWGMGTFNQHVLGAVALASSDYQLPPLIAKIAADLPPSGEMWNREQHIGSAEDFRDSGNSWSPINKVTYKTPDYMLCSAQDYYPGEKGYQQHIWQATFGPEALVFVTHPTCSSEEGSHRPGFWHGNETLPRVAQWKDVLVAVHKMRDDDWMGFTHAYFPTDVFNSCELRDGWAFARMGDGYIALTAARGIELIKTGDNAYRELRSYGTKNVWLCHMGRSALDGTFREFQEKILALKPQFQDLAVHLKTLRGDSLQFGWEGPLLLNEKEQPITGFKHYENPYCTVDLPASEMEIHFGEDGLRLKFGEESGM